MALVHDDLVQWGGAERVLSALTELFPNAPIYTSLFDNRNELLKEFRSKKIITSFLQKIPNWQDLYRALLPLYPIAFESFDFSEFDLVISHTTRFAKSVITKPKTVHVCYCHTPVRFLWNLSGEHSSNFLAPYFSFLRIYDKVASSRVDYWIAGSQNCKERISKIYRKEAVVCYPFVDLQRFEGIESFDGGYFLIVSRLNQYKRVDTAVEAFTQCGLKLKIVGEGPVSYLLRQKAGDNIEFLGSVSETLLVNLFAGCKALIVTAEEDFGLTALEANALGKPVIAYKSGGSLESVKDGKTGIFFQNQASDDLLGALKKCEHLKIKQEDCIENAYNFSKFRFKENFIQLTHRFLE